MIIAMMLIMVTMIAAMMKLLPVVMRTLTAITMEQLSLWN